MSKTFKWAVLFASAALMTGFTACGSDDDGDEPDGPDTPTATVGLRLYSVGGTSFSYDNQGRVDGYRSRYGEYASIDWENGMIESSDSEDGEPINFKTNGKGYFTEFSQSWNYKEDGDSYKGSGKMKFSYDKQGHLTKISVSMSESGKEDGESYKYEETSEIEYTWKDGNLVKGVCETIEKEDGEKDVYKTTANVAYGLKENLFNQYCLSLASDVIEFDFGDFALVGLLGVGPAQFPTVIETEEDDSDYNSSSTNNISISVNQVGLIETESSSNGYYVYSYENVPTSSKVAAKKVKKRPGSMFRMRKSK